MTHENYQKAQELEELRISQVGSYEEACALTNKPVRTLEEFKGFFGDERIATRAFGHHQIETMCTALNLNEDGSEYDADYNNLNQLKHFPWWDMETYNDDAPGSGFALRAVLCDYDFAVLGARLHVRSEKRGQHLAKVAKEAYRMWIRG